MTVPSAEGCPVMSKARMISYHFCLLEKIDSYKMLFNIPTGVWSKHTGAWRKEVWIRVPGRNQIITTMKNRGATPRCFNRVPKGKKDA